jgi:dTDP-glucose 4,6-dehydratase
MILATGGASFIGSNFVLDWLGQSDERVVNLDKLTYAGNINNLRSLEGNARHVFVHGDIGDSELFASILAEYKPRAIIHFAAESHVDRSIRGPDEFVTTKINGTLRCSKRRAATGPRCPRRSRPISASCTCRPMKSTAR